VKVQHTYTSTPQRNGYILTFGYSFTLI